MLYLVTGANGSGKTLLTLKHVKELADKEARPVCYNGRFDLNPDGPLAGWRKVDIKDWQSEADGTIFFVDECHNDFPVRPNSEKPPEYVRMLAEHRKRGFDFFLITQHPQNLDVFIRRLIGNPGWHRHLKRVAGAQIVSQLQWDAVNPNCEKPGAGNSGQVRTVAYPKEVYTWYHSAQLHTGKVKIPRAVYVLAVCALLVPLLGYFAFRTVTKNVMGRAEAAKPAAGAPGAAPVGAPGASGRADARQRPMTPGEYAEHRSPRFAGLAYTAPAYDAVTVPTVAPYPAACVEGVRPGTALRICTCWSQQGTVLPVPAEMCTQIVRNGFFVDWQQPQAVERQVPAVQQVGQPLPAGSAGVVFAEAVPVVQAGQVDGGQVQQPVARAPAPAPAPPPAAGPAPAAAGGRGFAR